MEENCCAWNKTGLTEQLKYIFLASKIMLYTGVLLLGISDETGNQIQ